MSATTILCSLLLAAEPGEAWQPCRGEHYCIPGSSICTVPTCEGELVCIEAGGGSMCVPACKHDAHCIDYDTAPPETDAGPQCFEGLCVVQCGGQCPAEEMACFPLYDDEGVCVWQPPAP